MSSEPQKRLARIPGIERQAETKKRYVDGEIRHVRREPAAHAHRDQHRRTLHAQFEASCYAFAADLRLNVSPRACSPTVVAAAGT
jgi:hypothetical protein